MSGRTFLSRSPLIMPKTVAGLTRTTILPKQTRVIITKLDDAELEGDWELVLKYSKELAENFMDLQDCAKATEYASRFENAVIKVYGKPTYESNKLKYDSALLAQHIHLPIQYGERLLNQTNDKEDLYEFIMQLGISYMERYEKLSRRTDLPKAYEYFLKAANMLKKENLNQVEHKKGYLSMNTGIYYRHNKEFDKAQVSFDRALRMSNELSDLN
jgi:tetratricopeptide (TPR) repeat protein